MEQLWGGIGAVFKSWNGKRAISYRRIEGIPDEWGTAVNVQAMVFGNMGDSLGHRRGVHPQPGHRREQVLRRMAGQRAGRRRGGRHPHPHPINEATKERSERNTAVARRGHAQPVQAARRTSAKSWKSITTTCRTSSSRSRKASSTCCSAASASAPARRAEHGHGHAARKADRREDRGDARAARAAGRAAAPDGRSQRPRKKEAIWPRAAGRTGRRVRPDRVHGPAPCVGQGRQTRHSRARRDQPGRRRRHARGAGILTAAAA
jgi:hypothetical protein